MKNGILSYGLVCLDLLRRKVYVKGESMVVRNKEFQLLKYFIQNVGRVKTRMEILEEVWDRNWCSNTNTVDVHVWSLRNKLKCYLGCECIRTVHCVGYIFEL